MSRNVPFSPTVKTLIPIMSLKLTSKAGYLIMSNTIGPYNNLITIVIIGSRIRVYVCSISTLYKHVVVSNSAYIHL